MGMDVRGLAPSALAGQEFRANIDWHLLITLVKRLCPDEAAPCKHWESNDGDGLDAAGASALAAKLEALMANGDVATYCAERDAHIAQAA